MWQKRGLDGVTKSGMLNEASLQSKEFHVTKCRRINSNLNSNSNLKINLNLNPSNMSEKLVEFSKETRSNRI